MRLALIFFLFPFLISCSVKLPADHTSVNFDGLANQDGLFESDDILDLRLSGDTRTLFNDRSDNAIYHPMEISYATKKGQTISIPLKVKTRGNFRRMKENCFYPPLWLNFSKTKTPETSLFAGQDKLKLVTPCRDQKFVVREYLVYKLYNLLSEQSFKVRLVRVVFADTQKGKDTNPLYGIILEDEDEMAKRNNAVILKKNKLRPNKTDREAFLRMAVFEFMIANTDWSVQYRHNVKLLASEKGLLPITVPYDFDHAGIVNTPYAHPAPQLNLRSVRERLYRGYCMEDMSEFEVVFAQFNALKDEFYKVYTESEFLEERNVKTTIKYLDEFYKDINNPKISARAFLYPCDPNGTGSIIIQGLKKRK
ncbi:MAG: hypothetical protein GY705_16895 [Bacteroidetes bacterium]|nr:hypothetical protein [Bacteroidota bacterium]